METLSSTILHLHPRGSYQEGVRPDGHSLYPNRRAVITRELNGRPPATSAAKWAWVPHRIKLFLSQVQIFLP